MKISGFTIARGAVTYGYPLKESILSLLPMVDEYVIGIGDLDDGTLEMVQSIDDSKIKIFRSKWDMNTRVNGQLLADQTNIALDRVSGAWAVYLQADEVLHEDSLERLRKSLIKYHDRPTEGLSFNYLHFYGSFDVIQDNRFQWYRTAVRAIKTGLDIRSVGDAYGFSRFANGTPRDIKTAPSGVTMYHYGWVRPPEVMLERSRQFAKMYHDDEWVENWEKSLKKKDNAKVIEFYSHRGHLKFFTGDHPSVMEQRIKDQNWTFDHRIEHQPPDWIRYIIIWTYYPLRKIIRKLLRK